MPSTSRSKSQRITHSTRGPDPAERVANPTLGGMEHALLGLVRSRPMHAYEMYQQLTHAPDGQALGRVWRLKQSHLYALLAKLEAAGYLAGTTEPQGTRPPRRVLRLSLAGEAAFVAWVVAPVRHGRDFRLEFLAKLYSAEREGTSTVATLLSQQREACISWLDALHAQVAQLDTDCHFDRLVLQFRISQIEAILRWLDHCAPDPDAPAS